MRRDLLEMGFKNVIELNHGESLGLGGDFEITSYHFSPFLDSTLVIEGDGYTLFNANDAKVMGLPLMQIVKRHPRIDFVFRSHSSANSRLCFEIIDRPSMPIDDAISYVRDFARFVHATGAKYAIPFASNHCFLHKDVFHLNQSVTTPKMVASYFEANKLRTPQLQIMVTGDYWSDADGFVTTNTDYFTNRQERLEQYRADNRAILDKYYAQEARATITLTHFNDYFTRVFQAMPGLVRRMYRDNPILYVLSAGDSRRLFEVDIGRRQVRNVTDYNDHTHPIQIHTSAAVMRQCMAMNLFSHLAISKRVRYRVTAKKKCLLTFLNLFFNFYEYEFLPLGRIMNRRFLSCWIRRWRELVLYFQIGKEVALGRAFNFSRYLPSLNNVDRVAKSFDIQKSS